MTGRGEKRAYRLCGVRAGCDFTAGALLTVIEKVSLLEQKMELCIPGGITNSGTYHSRSGFRHSVFLYCRKRPAPDEGFRAAASEHRPEGCVSQDGCRLCSRGCSWVPRAVVQSRVPAVPQGLCAGAGTLPPAMLSIQPARCYMKEKL